MLPDHEAGDTEFGGPDAIVMAEGTAALAHDHGFQAAVTLGGGILKAVLCEGLHGEVLAMAARV